jgi:VWFA-related protein
MIVKSIRGAIGAFIVLAAIPAAAQQPRFEGSVDVVAVDALVVDGKGSPVADLRPEEFSVKVDGRMRRVVSARFVETSGPAARTNASMEAGVPSPSSAGTAAPPGRRIVILVDRGELDAGAAEGAVSAARRFVAEAPAGDSIAVFSVPSGPRVDFTADRAQLDATLAKIGPAKETFFGEFNISISEALTHVQWPSRSGLESRECALFAQSTRPHVYEMCVMRVESEARRLLEDHRRGVRARLEAIESICAALALLPGPKVAVLVSGGFTSVLSAGGEDVIERLRRIANAAAAARVSLYSLYFAQRHEATAASVSRERFSREADQRMLAEGLEALTGMAGGALFEVMAAPDWAFERVATETSGYYLLGLEPAGRDRDGKPHDIEVKVARPGAEVRSRRRFVISAAAAATPPPRGRAFPVPRRDPIRIATHVLRGPSEAQLKVVVIAEVDELREGRLNLDVVDPTGKIVGSVGGEMDVAPGDAVARYDDALLLSRGPCVLRAAALDPAGRQIAKEQPLNVELAHGVGFDASDLLLFEQRDGGRRMAGRSVHGGRMHAYLELYLHEGLPADALGVTVDVVDADGTRRATAVLTVREGAEDGLAFAEGPVDLASVAPGAYVARAVVTFGAKVARRIERPFERSPGQSTSR